jgi:undecaprenyl-diphosphatase
MVKQRWIELDQHYFARLFLGLGQGRLRRLSYWMSKTADGPLYILLALSLYWQGGPAALEFVTVLALAFCIELPAYLLLKNLFRRQRPAVALAGQIQAHIEPSDRFSLPSGHTAGAFVLVSCIAVLAPVWLPLALLWGCMVGMSRVLLGVHFPGDILAGMALGSGSVLAAVVHLS